MKNFKKINIVFLVVSITALGMVSIGWAQNAPVPQDHGIIYKQAVGLLDKADQKLNGNYTAEAKSLLKEAKSLFSILQKELPKEKTEQELSETQQEQWANNNKLGEDSYAQGERLEASAKQKHDKSDAIEKQGQKDLAIKLESESKRENELAQKMYLKSQIYHLRNMQLAYSFLRK
jgi:hypothetical protein